MLTTPHQFQIEKRTDVTTIVDVSFEKINDFIRFRKLCAVKRIQMKTSPSLDTDDANVDSVADFMKTDEIANECTITSTMQDENLEWTSENELLESREHADVDSCDAHT